MIRRPVLLGLLLLVAACSSAPTDVAPKEKGPAALPGLTVVDESGDQWAEYPPVRAARESLDRVCAEAAETVARRLGLALDPDRLRRLRIVSSPRGPDIETVVIDGRLTQVMSIPAAPLARGNVPLEETAVGLMARAAISDAAPEELPAWYVAGAPLWVSGALDRALARRILGGPRIPDAVDDVAPPLSLTGRTADPVSAGLFFRFVGEEFGAEKIPALSRALLVAENPGEAFAAALGVDADSLPVAFDGYRRRAVSEDLGNDFMRLLAASRLRAPSDRIPALSGLSMRAPNRFVAAAILADLAVAQFESAEYAAAARTLAVVEQEYARWAMNPDRNLLLFALTFARQGDEHGASIRIRSFLAEFPESPWAPLALFELAAMETEAGRTEEALVQYRRIVDAFPQSPYAGPSRIVLAAAARSRHRYAVARSLLEEALPDETAAAALKEIEELEKVGLPEDAKPIASSAVRDLVSQDSERGRKGVEALLEIGPASRTVLADQFRGEVVLERSPAARLRAVSVLGSWPRAVVWPDPLVAFLAGDDVETAKALFEVLRRLEVPEAEIEVALNASPLPTPAATAEFDRRFRAASGTDALLRSEAFRDRMMAATRLATEERHDAVALLGKLLADRSPQVRRVAAAALGEREQTEEAQAALGPALDDSSRLVRIEACRSFMRLGDAATVRARGLSDEDPLVRIEAARSLYLAEDPADLARVVGLLNDPEATVRSAIETILRSEAPVALGKVLADAFRTAEMPGHASRILRVMSHHTGSDFGYDRAGGRDERERVATAFLAAWDRRAR